MDPAPKGVDGAGIHSVYEVVGKELFWAITEMMPHYTKHMRLLSKNRPYTWLPNEGSKLRPQDLDHVVAASHLRFTQFDGAKVDVRGWAGTEISYDWTEKYSDHALLYFEVEVA